MSVVLRGEELKKFLANAAREAARKERPPPKRRRVYHSHAPDDEDWFEARADDWMWPDVFYGDL